MSYLPHSPDDVRRMLEAIGVGGVDELYRTIPEDLLLGRDLDLPPPLSEWEVVRNVRALAGANRELICFAGGGIYDHYIPAAVDQILRRSEFYTAYTPYQAEVSQGTLQAIYEFQTVVCELTGMDLANASMYDGATAMAEAVLMAVSVKRGKRSRVVVSESLHPHYRKVLATYNTGLKLDVVTAPQSGGRTDSGALGELVDDDTAAVVVQSPNFFGIIEDWGGPAEIAHERGALLVAVFDPVAAALLETPGEAGADIAVGEGQPLGNAMSFGGPGVGLFSCRSDFLRQVPGRVSGATVDQDGKRAFVLALQTREQHIRREKATSNICTNHALNALAALVHVAAMGRTGLEQAAEVSLRKAHYAYDVLSQIEGFEPLFPEASFFKEFALRTPVPAAELIRRVGPEGFLAGIDLGPRFPDISLGIEEGLLVAVTEKRTREEIDAFAGVLAGATATDSSEEVSSDERSVAWRR